MSTPRRSRTLWILAGVVVVAGCAARIGFAARPWLKHREVRLPFDARMTAIGTLGAAELAKMTAVPPAELKTACAGKLPHVEPQALLAYFGPLPDKLSTFGGELPRNQLYGFGKGNSNPQLSLHFEGMPFEDNEYRSRTLWDFIFDKSENWGSMIDSFKASSPQADLGRYLLVHRMVEWTMPKVLEGGEFKPGTALIHVRVLDAVSGQQLCEGTVTPRSASKITSHARGSTKERAEGMAQAQMHKGAIIGFGQAITASGLDVLCDVAGETACKSTDAHIEKVDVFY
jgi:hypothetical protein